MLLSTNQQLSPPKARSRRLHQRRSAFGPYFLFLVRYVSKRFANWLLFGAYLLLLTLILVIVPVALDASPAAYWNNPLIQLSSFVMPLAAVFGACMALDVFRGGIDTGIELIVVAKPVSRLVLTSAKLLFLFCALTLFGVASALCGLLALVAPKMETYLVGDLAAGLFTGTFINGLFFAAIAVFLSLRIGKNATTLIVILIAIVLNFLTPLAPLLFQTPAEVLQNRGVYLVQQKWQARDAQQQAQAAGTNGTDVIFQVRTTYGNTQYVDVKQAYQEADAQTPYSASFYGNIGNMINSLYNVGNLASEKNANIAFAPRNTRWTFRDVITPDNFTRLMIGSDALSTLAQFNPNPDATDTNPNNNSLSYLLLTRQYVFLGLPTTDQYGPASILFSPPGWRYLQDAKTNQTVRVNATAADYVYDVNKIDQAMGHAQTGWQQTLSAKNDANKDYKTLLIEAMKNVANATITPTNPPGSPSTTTNPSTTTPMPINEALQELIGVYSQLLTSAKMDLFRTAYEASAVVKDDNAASAKNLFLSKLALFYGLDRWTHINPALTRPLLPTGFSEYSKQFSSSLDKDATLFKEATNWQLFAAYLATDPLYYNVVGTNNLDTPEKRMQAFVDYILAFGLNTYAAVYLMNLLTPTNVTREDGINYRAALGIYQLRSEQINKTYAVVAQPIVGWQVIVLVMSLIACALFIGVGLVSRWQDIR